MSTSQDQQTQLGKLLQRERSKTAAMRVDEVLESDLPTAEKIKKIEDIDAAAAEPGEKSGGYLSRPKSQKTGTVKKDVSPDEAPVLDEHITTGTGFREIQRNRSRIKQHLYINGLFKYLFKELQKIKKFGSDTHIITSGFFSFSLYANKDVRVFLHEHIRKTMVPEIMKVTRVVLKIGWKHLTKREYNLVVLFHELCLEISETDFSRLNYKNRYLIDHLGHLERLFLCIQSDRDNLSRIISAIEETRHKDPKSFEEEKGISHLVKNLLTKEGTLPSLYHFFLGLNMLKHRRYLTMNDLIRKDAGPVVDTREFDCAPEIVSEIKGFVRDCEDQLVPLIKQQEEIMRLRAFIPSDEADDSDDIAYSLLAETYDGYFEEKYGRTFKRDKEQLFSIAPGIFMLFLTDFKVLLMEKIAIKNVGVFRIFSPRCFDIEISKVQSCYEKMEKMSGVMPSFPRKRFLILKNNRKGAIENEAEVLQVIDDAFNSIYNLGNKLAKLLRNRLGGMQPEGGFKPLEPLVFQGKPFFLPYDSNLLDSGGILVGKSVAEALSLICSICYLSSIFFMNNSITSILARERRLADKLSGLTNSLQRVMSQEGFQFVKAKYGLTE